MCECIREEKVKKAQAEVKITDARLAESNKKVMALDEEAGLIEMLSCTDCVDHPALEAFIDSCVRKYVTWTVKVKFLSYCVCFCVSDMCNDLGSPRIFRGRISRGPLRQIRL